MGTRNSATATKTYNPTSNVASELASELASRKARWRRGIATSRPPLAMVISAHKLTSLEDDLTFVRVSHSLIPLCSHESTQGTLCGSLHSREVSQGVSKEALLEGLVLDRVRQRTVVSVVGPWQGPWQGLSPDASPTPVRRETGQRYSLPARQVWPGRAPAKDLCQRSLPEISTSNL